MGRVCARGTDYGRFPTSQLVSIRVCPGLYAGAGIATLDMPVSGPSRASGLWNRIQRIAGTQVKV
jgi:hypothetical protein